MYLAAIQQARQLDIVKEVQIFGLGRLGKEKIYWASLDLSRVYINVR